MATCGRATELSAALLEHSGIRALQRVLEPRRTAARASLLKARSALVALRAIAVVLRPGRRDAEPVEVVEAIDRLEASSGALALLRLQHLVLAGHLELERVGARGGRPAVRPGRCRAPGRPGRRRRRPTTVRAAALAGVERWRARAGNPLSDRRLIEAAEIVSRAYEEIYAGAG